MSEKRPGAHDARMKKWDERIDKRRVTMVNVVVDPTNTFENENGEIQVATITHKAVDYVRPDFLDAYVADARSKGWTVLVSDEPDAGPAGYHGPTNVPESLNHPLAGQTFEETKP
jgi:hypothetical protein